MRVTDAIDILFYFIICSFYFSFLTTFLYFLRCMLRVGKTKAIYLRKATGLIIIVEVSKSRTMCLRTAVGYPGLNRGYPGLMREYPG